MNLTVGRHEVAELRLDAGELGITDAASRPRLEVTEPAGQVRRLPTFLTSDGGVGARYASGIEGSYRYRWLAQDGSPLVAGPTGVLEVRGPSVAQGQLIHGPVRVASTGKHFEHEDGTPFLWLGDTWWHALTPRISDEELQELAAFRARQGFTLVQCRVGVFLQGVSH